MQKTLIPATARGEATRRKLLAAAETEFGDKGFHTASVSSITTLAGVGQGTFYLYFRSKEEIFATLVNEIGQTLRRRLLRAEQSTAGGSEAERRSLEAFLAFAQERPGLYRIVQEAQFVDEPAFRDYHERLAEGYQHAFRDVDRHGELSSEDVEARAWSLLGIGHFLGLRYCLWQGRLPESSVVDEVMSMISHGLSASASAG